MVTEDKVDTRLEMYIQQSGEGRVDSTTPVRWCINPELAADIKRRGFIKPMLVLVVRALDSLDLFGSGLTEPYTTATYVVSLTREMEFVRFQRAGRNEVRALIVDANNKDSIDGICRTRDNNEFLHSDGSPRYLGSLKYIAINNYLEVNVPQEMFAKPPSERRLKFIGRFFSKVNIDQCHMKKKTIASALAAVVLLTIGQVIKLVLTLGAAFFGFRDIDWNSLLHPWSTSFNEPIEDVGTSFWFTDERGGARGFNPLTFINPVVLVALPTFVYGLVQLFGAHDTQYAHGKEVSAVQQLHHQLSYPGYWDTFWRVNLAWIGLVLGITLVVVLVGLVISLIGKINGSETRQAKLRQQKETDKLAKLSRLERELAAMACGRQSSLQPTLGALPSNKKTVHLLWQTTKAKVCKPYAR